MYFGKELKDSRPLELPCGRCIGCRIVRQRAWALRILHEAKCHSDNSFITLTYDEENYSPSLNYSDFQVFMRKLRRKVGPARFFCCGEYGETNLRPHFHAILFGRDFERGRMVAKNVYYSRTLADLWPHGMSSVGSVTYASAQYVASYTLKKVVGESETADRLRAKRYDRVDLRTGEVVRVVPEFGRMSLKPGIGYDWFQKYWKEVYLVRDGVVMPGGYTVPPPRYYDKLLEEVAGDLSDVKGFLRYCNSLNFIDDTSPERLAVREVVAFAKSKHKVGKYL